MAYTKINFVNDETDASAENFNHMESGIANSYNVSLLAVSDTAPSECSTGDKYYNTSTKKIYTSTSEDTWGTTGEDPISDILYIVLEERTSYTYDGTDLVSVGGGSGSEIVVEPDEQTEDTKLIFESIDLDAQYTEAEYYSTEEVKTNKVWIDGKPIYRKVIQVTAGEIRNNDSKLNLTISSLVNLYGFLSRSNYGYMPFNNTFTPTTGTTGFNCALYYSPNNNRIEGSIDTAFADNREAIIIVEYTKNN